MSRIYPRVSIAINTIFMIFLLASSPLLAQEIIFADSLEQAAEIVSFTASPASIEQGENITISWTTVGATVCVTSGDVDEWDQVSIDLPNGNAVIKINQAGDATFTLICDGIVGDLAFANQIVTVSPVPAVITSFSASPDAIAEGENTTISWTTDFATSCTPSNGAGGWSEQTINLPDGSAEITIPTAETYTFTLTCNGAVGDPVVATDTVTVSQPALITSFGASLTSLAENQITTFTWATENVVSCVASNGAGGWSAEVLSLPNGSAQIAITTAGVYTFTMTCEGEAGAPAVASEVITVSAAAEITSFVATPDSVTTGETTTLSWTTENATSCTPSGGEGDWDLVSIDLPSGQATVEVTTEGDLTFTLTCEGVAGAAAVANEIVVVNPDLSACSPSPLSGNIKTWKDFWLVDFPAPLSDKRLAFIQRFGYLAIEFETGNVVDDGKMSAIETTFEDGLRLGSFSKCPGDFDVTPECDYTWGNGGGLRWATNGRSLACQLEPNTTYYFNITFTDGFDRTKSSCDVNAVACVTNLDVLNLP